MAKFLKNISNKFDISVFLIYLALFALVAYIWSGAPNLSKNMLDLIQTVAVIGATLSAAYSAKLTSDAVQQTKLQSNPKVIVYIKKKENDLFTAYLAIKNEGIRSARDIGFSIEGDDLEILGGTEDQKISEMEVIKNGIALLPGSSEIIHPIAIMIGEKYTYLMNSKCTIRVSYRNDEEDLFEDRYNMDFSSLTHLKIGESVEEKAAKALESIRDELHSIQGHTESLANNGIVRPQWQYGEKDPHFVEHVTGEKRLE